MKHRVVGLVPHPTTRTANDALLFHAVIIGLKRARDYAIDPVGGVPVPNSIAIGLTASILNEATPGSAPGGSAPRLVDT